MEPTFTFLSVEDVLSLHEDEIDAWGGTHGIRDRGLLESVVGAAMNVALYDAAADVYDVWPLSPRSAGAAPGGRGGELTEVGIWAFDDMT